MRCIARPCPLAHGIEQAVREQLGKNIELARFAQAINPAARWPCDNSSRLIGIAAMGQHGWRSGDLREAGHATGNARWNRIALLERAKGAAQRIERTIAIKLAED